MTEDSAAQKGIEAAQDAEEKPSRRRRVGDLFVIYVIPIMLAVALVVSGYSQYQSRQTSDRLCHALKDSTLALNDRTKQNVKVNRDIFKLFQAIDGLLPRGNPADDAFQRYFTEKSAADKRLKLHPYHKIEECS
jgi:hypothetical protein